MQDMRLSLHAESVIKDKERFIKGILKDMGSINRDRSKSLSGRVRKLKAEVAEADERYVKLYDDQFTPLVPFYDGGCGFMYQRFNP